MQPGLTDVPANGGDRHKAVLIDRHPLWLDIIERTMTELGADVVGKFTSFDRGVEALEELKPATLIIDIAGRDPAAEEPDGVEYVRRAVELVPDLKAVVFSSKKDGDLIDAAFAAGASAYIIKTVQPDDFASAIRQVFTLPLHSGVGRTNRTTISSVQEAKESGLSAREVEILRIVAEGLTNTQVAQALFVTEQTVKFHLSNIYRKLGLANRTEASRWAQVHGLLKHGDYERVLR